MAVFRFTLEPVLRQRELAEREHQRRVASVERERIALEDTLRDQQREIEREEAELAALTAGPGCVPRELRDQGVALLAARSRARATASLLAAAHARLAKARAALGQAAAARRSMELLRDRRRKEFESAEAKADAVLADDIASNPAFRSAEEAA